MGLILFKFSSFKNDPAAPKLNDLRSPHKIHCAFKAQVLDKSQVVGAGSISGVTGKVEQL